MSTENKVKSGKPSTPGKSSPLIVGPVIKPLAGVKKAHNNLVNLVKTATGKGGLTITVSDSRMTIDASNVTASNVSELHFRGPTCNVDIDDTGIVMTLNWNGDTISWLANTGTFKMYDDSSGNTLEINTSDMFYGNYTMREFTICDSGNVANVRILCSENY